MSEKCIVLLSGGLDSRLALKIMQEQLGEENVSALFFNLPFGNGCCSKSCSFNFTQMQGVRLEVIDCSRGQLLAEYLDVLKKAEHGRGSGVNACIDCRIFIFSKAREFADSKGIKLLATGEVLGERPMSQMNKSLSIIEEKSGLSGRILRPLSAKHLEMTDAEKEGTINREELYDIQGRRRVEQMRLAEKFKIDYPTPGGGCLLCEKGLKKRLSYLLKRGMDEHEVKLVSMGRHFLIGGIWIVLGRNKDENILLDNISKKKGKLIVPDYAGPSALIVDDCSEELIGKVDELMKVYSNEGTLAERKRYEKFRL